MTGKDVTQLQQSLQKLGHDPRDTAGTFDTGTKQALKSLYSALGYDIAVAGDDKCADRRRSAGDAGGAGAAGGAGGVGPAAAESATEAGPRATNRAPEGGS
jgi:hypothetical protein